jgi:hypothetical protein
MQRSFMSLPDLATMNRRVNHWGDFVVFQFRVVDYAWGAFNGVFHD